MRLTKKLLFTLIVMVIFGVSNIPNLSLAASELILLPSTENIIKEGHISNISYSFNFIGLESTQYLKIGGASIEKLSGKLRLSGYTESYEPVDTIGVIMYLQRWDQAKSLWVDIIKAGEASNHQFSKVDLVKDALVASGYYYRVRAIHYIVKGDTIEQFNSTTDSVYFE